MKYYLQEGTEVSLLHLIAKEPAWARNRIIEGERDAELLKVEQDLCSAWMSNAEAYSVAGEKLQAENKTLREALVFIKTFAVDDDIQQVAATAIEETDNG